MWKNRWWYYHMKVQTVPEKKNCSSNPSFPTIEIPCNQRSLTWAFSRPSHLHWGSNFTLLPSDSQKIVNKQLKWFSHSSIFHISVRSNTILWKSNGFEQPYFWLWSTGHRTYTVGLIIRFTKSLVKQTLTWFFRMSNGLKPVHLFVIVLEHTILCFERTDI